MKTESEGELTLTPSGFLFSRLLATVETKITMPGNQWPAGVNKHTHTRAHTHTHSWQVLFKAGQLPSASKWALLELEAEEKNANQVRS